MVGVQGWRRFAMLLGLVATMALVGCQSTAGGSELAAPLDEPIAFRVGSRVVTVSEFQARIERDLGAGIEQLIGQGQTREQIEQLATEQNVRQSIFDTMIQEELLIDLARREGIGIDPANVDAALEAQLPPPESPLAATFDETAARSEIVQQQLILEVIARYTTADQSNVRHILVGSESEADEIIAALAGGADFASLAQERSLDTGSGANGGELGWAPRGEYVAPFEEAAFSAPLNTPTKVQSEFGWHIIEVLERESNRGFANFGELSRFTNAQSFFETSFLPWYEQLRSDATASGDLQITPGFDPNSVPLPFTE